VIMMQQPALAINSDDVPGPKYIMWQTKSAPRGVEAGWTVSQILASNREALYYHRSQLLNVVINCHGSDGSLAIGGRGAGGGHINSSNVGAFVSLKGLNIGTMWLVACEAAKGPAGKAFCQTLSTLSGCQVVAADEEQDVGFWGGYRLLAGLHGQIDEFEGTVYRFTVVGGMQAIDPHKDIYTIKD